MKPIPKSLLIHTVQYKEYIENAGGWGGNAGNYKPAVEYKHVRIEPSTQMITDNNGQSITARGIMFVDMVHSDYNNNMPKEKSKVTFNGVDYVVKQVDYLYARTLHHLEVLLA